MNKLNKQRRDRLVDREQDDSDGGRRLGDGKVQQKGKRTHGHGRHCGDCWGEGSLRGLNSKGKTI